MIEDLKPYAEYKESGLSWLGQVPGHWVVSPLARLARLKSVINQSDRQLLSVYLQRGVVRFSDVAEKRTNTTSEDLSKYQAVDPGDFVLNNQQAWRGSVGVSDFSGIVSPAYLVLTLSDQYLPRYANPLFRDQSVVDQYLICSKGVGTIQRNLYWPHLKRVGVVVPPPEEQAAIVRFLDWANGRLERAIRAKRKVIALLNEQKQAIIHRAVTRGLDPSVSLKPSGIPWLGPIPGHWEIRRAKYAARILRGKFTHRPRNDPSLYDGPYPFIQTGAVAQAEKFVTSFKQTLNEKGLAVSKLFPSGTLVMTMLAAVLIVPSLAGCGPSTTAPETAPPVDAAADRAALLAVEERWLAAITSGDRATVEAILAPAYRHINADGVLIDRDEELAGTAPLPVVFNLGEPLIDIVGDTAVLRGINTITQDGSVVDCQRFTDVFIRVGIEWKALAAQETRLAPEVCAAPAP